MIEIRKTDVFAKWLDSLKDVRAKARILVRIDRMQAGNLGDVSPVGEGVSELRIFYCQQQLKTDPQDQLKSDPLFYCGFH